MGVFDRERSPTCLSDLSPYLKTILSVLMPMLDTDSDRCRQHDTRTSDCEYIYSHDTLGFVS